MGNCFGRYEESENLLESHDYILSTIICKLDKIEYQINNTVLSQSPLLSDKRQITYV